MRAAPLDEKQRDVFLKFSEISLPRHTSFPIHPLWSKEWDHFSFEPELISKMKDHEQISLYVHVPFCKKLCHYCACNKEIVPDEIRQKQDPSYRYLRLLGHELKLLFDQIGRKKIKQLHLGGGSPTLLKKSQLNLLMEQIATWFDLSECSDMAIEIDPRITTKEQLTLLKNIGFTRVSLGIQDFDPQVQQAIGRVQPVSMVEEFYGWVKEVGFESVNFDLIYGLPLQTEHSLRKTVAKVVEMSPDRIAFYRLALLPDVYRWQRTFKKSAVPDSEAVLNFLEIITSGFHKDYEMIGFDHFAKRSDPLLKAKEDGSVRRNFQGMSTARKLPILGIGPSAISDLNGVYSQNEKTLKAWGEKLEKGLLAASTGLVLSRLDVLRKQMLDDLYGRGFIDLNRYVKESEKIGEHLNLSSELKKISKLVELELVTFKDGVMELTKPLGQMLARVAGAAFDPYLPESAYLEGLTQLSLSKV